MNIKSFLLSVLLMLNVTACQSATSIDEASSNQVTMLDVDKAAQETLVYLDQQARHVVVNSFAYMSDEALRNLVVESYFDLTRGDVDPLAQKIMHMMNTVNQKIALGTLDKYDVQKQLDVIYDAMDEAIVHVNAAYSLMAIVTKSDSINVRIDALHQVVKHIEVLSLAINKAAKGHNALYRQVYAN